MAHQEVWSLHLGTRVETKRFVGRNVRAAIRCRRQRFCRCAGYRYFNRTVNGDAPADVQSKKLDFEWRSILDSAHILLNIVDLNNQSASAEGEGTSTTTTDGESEEDLDSLTSLLAEDLVASRKKK